MNQFMIVSHNYTSFEIPEQQCSGVSLGGIETIKTVCYYN